MTSMTMNAIEELAARASKKPAAGKAKKAAPKKAAAKKPVAKSAAKAPTKKATAVAKKQAAKPTAKKASAKVAAPAKKPAAKAKAPAAASKKASAKTPALTPNEKEVLRGVADSDYHDGIEDKTGNPVWSWSCNPWEGTPKSKSFPGVVSSLVKKGLLEHSPGATQKDDCLAFTAKGAALAKALPAAQTPAATKPTATSPEPTQREAVPVKTPTTTELITQTRAVFDNDMLSLSTNGLVGVFRKDIRKLVDEISEDKTSADMYFRRLTSDNDPFRTFIATVFTNAGTGWQDERDFAVLDLLKRVASPAGIKEHMAKVMATGSNIRVAARQHLEELMEIEKTGDDKLLDKTVKEFIANPDVNRSVKTAVVVSAARSRGVPVTGNSDKHLLETLLSAVRAGASGDNPSLIDTTTVHNPGAGLVRVVKDDAEDAPGKAKKAASKRPTAAGAKKTADHKAQAKTHLDHLTSVEDSGNAAAVKKAAMAFLADKTIPAIVKAMVAVSAAMSRKVPGAASDAAKLTRKPAAIAELLRAALLPDAAEGSFAPPTAKKAAAAKPPAAKKPAAKKPPAKKPAAKTAKK